jgi:hypothetical protein
MSTSIKLEHRLVPEGACRNSKSKDSSRYFTWCLCCVVISCVCRDPVGSMPGGTCRPDQSASQLQG